MGATRLSTTPDAVYIARNARYLRNRDAILARSKAQYAETRDARREMSATLRRAARHARLRTKTQALRADRPAPRNALAVQAWIQEQKDQQPCLDCHRPYPFYVMDFDHIRPGKRRALSDCHTFAQARYELALCEPVCANCHRVRTHLAQLSK